MHKAIAFCRRSTIGQDNSIHGQKTYLQDWIKNSSLVKKLEINTTLLRFVEYTGTGARRGKALDAILEEVRSGYNEYKFIIVERLDRFQGRMGLRAVLHLLDLADHGVYVIVAYENRIGNDFSSLDDEIRT